MWVFNFEQNKCPRQLIEFPQKNKIPKLNRQQNFDIWRNKPMVSVRTHLFLQLLRRRGV
jgi:hypothetical protein